MADTVQSAAEKLKVFISYARADGAALAEDLVTGLGLAGFAPFLDRHDIAAAEDWEARLGGLIQSADTIVFIITPTAVKSERCAWEVEHAAKLGKRLIPIQLVSLQGQRVPESDVPDRLRRLNYIFFNEGQSSLKALSELATALRQDVEWIREHTRLSEIAARWDARRSRAGGEADDLLLRGDDLIDARAWVARRKEDSPEITALQRSYLAASESFATSLSQAEKKRLEERERLIAETETAQHARRRFQRRMFGVLGVFATLVVLGTGAGLWSVFTSWQRQMIDRSQFVAEMVDKKADEAAYVDAMLIGLDALPDDKSFGNSRPPDAIGRLGDARARWCMAQMVIELGRANKSSGAHSRYHSGGFLAGRQARPHRLLRRDGKAVGRSDRRRSRHTRGTHSPCHRGCFLARRHAHSHRLRRQHGKTVGSGDRSPDRDACRTQRRCQFSRLLAGRQAPSHRLVGQDGKAVGRGHWRRGCDARRTQRLCQRRRLLARRQARSHRLLRRDGQALGHDNRRRDRNLRRTQRRCHCRRLFARRQTGPHRMPK
jgi:hypothetical protein